MADLRAPTVLEELLALWRLATAAERVAFLAQHHEPGAAGRAGAGGGAKLLRGMGDAPKVSDYRRRSGAHERAHRRQKDLGRFSLAVHVHVDVLLGGIESSRFPALVVLNVPGKLWRHAFRN